MLHGDSFLEFEGVTVKFLNNTLLSDLSFKVNKGENWALTGESGSGKSALLGAIAGKFAATGGKTSYHFYEERLKSGAQIDPYYTHHRMISFVEPKHHFRNLSHTTDFYYQQRYNSADSEDALTVDEYLATIDHDKNSHLYWNIEKVINRLKLDTLRDKQLIKLSNGETKRLLISAALLKNPSLLLLDNPLTGLDVQTRAEFNQIISDIVASGITVIMATTPFEIPESITHVATMHQGKIIKIEAAKNFSPEHLNSEIDTKIDNNFVKSLIPESQAKYDWIVKMTDVNIRYGNKQVLEGINWQIKQGERWALLGPNGAGKSTLLSLINGDNPQAYANDIVLFDKKRGSGESIWDIKSKIGFVSPEFHQYFPVDNSCLQVIESGFYDTLGLFRPSQSNKVGLALEWMKALEIEKYARILLKNIPASAQRLCLLARALVKNPPLLIFDEPCQGMDQHQQQHFKLLVDTICSQSDTTLIYVTHYEHEIPASVNQVLKLEKGKTAT